MKTRSKTKGNKFKAIPGAIFKVHVFKTRLQEETLSSN